MHLGKGHGLSTVDRIGLLVIFIDWNYNKNGKYKKKNQPKKQSSPYKTEQFGFLRCNSLVCMFYILGLIDW